MGCLMKNDIAKDSILSHDCFVLQINGRPSSVYRRYEDALREGLQRKYRSPHDDIRVFEINPAEEAKQDTALH